MVKVFLEYSGGMGLSVNGSLDTEELDDDLRAEAEAVLDPARPKAAPEPANPQRTEVEQYSLVVEGRRIVVDSQGDQQLKAVAGKLRKALIRKKRGR